MVAVSQIPNRSLFRQPEVCEIAQVQPYVLRSWEAEFPDLGVAKSAGGARVYRKADVERVLRIKHLLFVEGLTLAGVRRRLHEEQGTSPENGNGEGLDDLLSSDVRERILSVRQSLRELSAMLARDPVNGHGQAAAEFTLAAPQPAAAKTPARRPAPKKVSTAAKRTR